MKNIFRLFLFLIPIFFTCFIATAEEFTQKKKFRDWSIFSSKNGNCFLASNAKTTKSIVNSSEIMGRNRVNSFVYFFLNKTNNSYSISYFSDFPLQNNGYGVMRIDNKKEISLRMIGSENANGIKNAESVSLSESDVNLLISGTRITIIANALDNSTLVDQFSLIGFTKSLRYLSSRCI